LLRRAKPEVMVVAVGVPKAIPVSGSGHAQRTDGHRLV